MRTEHVKRVFAAGAAASLFVAFAIACSSSSGGGGGGTTDASPDRATEDEPFVANPNNCVKPGDPGNDYGVGAYCDPTKSCPTSKQQGVFLVCTSVAEGTPTDHYFCTAPCTENDECGKDAYCAKGAGGSGCVPFACGSPDEEDAGADAPPDGPADAADAG